MGKGDRKTRRGKLWRGSHGVRRPKHHTTTSTGATAAEPETKEAPKKARKKAAKKTTKKK